MNNLETGKDKIKKICDVLKNETLDPAKQEAEKIVADAQAQAHTIVQEAKKEAEKLHSQTQEKIVKERGLFDKQVEQALAQAKETLRQELEQRLFNQGIAEWLEQKGVNEQMSAQLITALVEAIEKEGTSADLSAVVGKAVNRDEVQALLLDKVLKKLEKKAITVGEFVGGIQLQLHDRQLTLDLSDQALKELLGHYIRKDFRALLFQD